jgi:DNA-binding CsgD family transcriptional regulator
MKAKSYRGGAGWPEGAHLVSERMLDVAGLAYDAAMDDALWPMVGHALAELVGGRTTALWVGDSARGEVELLDDAGVPEPARQAYIDHYHRKDIWSLGMAEAMRARGAGAATSAMLGQELVSAAALRRSEIYVDYMRHFGFFHMVGNASPVGEVGYFSLGIHRPEHEAAFTERERDLLNAVLPHLRRALRLRYRLRGAAALPLVALDALSLPAIVLDAELRLLHANPAALAMLTPGGALRQHRSGVLVGPTSLTAAHRAEQGLLERLVRAVALGVTPGGGVRVTAEDGACHALVVLPLPSRLAGRDGPPPPGLVLLLARPLGGRAPPLELLREVFGLGAVEAEVAAALAGGVAAEVVAAQRGVGIGTVRAQIRSILQKTGAHGLRDLERMMALLAV